MTDDSNIKGEGFEEFIKTEGMLNIEVMGMKQEVPYKAHCYMNSKRTMGYAEMIAAGKGGYIFLSKTASGEIVTIPGNQEGIVEMEIEGIYKLMSVPENAPFERFYEKHIEALGEEDPIPDEAWLREEVPKLPDRTMAIVMKLLESVFAAFGGVDGLAEDMGEAMAKMMETMMSTMAQGLQGPSEDGSLDNIPTIDLDEEKEAGDAPDVWTCPACGKSIDPDDERCKHCGEEM